MARALGEEARGLLQGLRRGGGAWQSPRADDGRRPRRQDQELSVECQARKYLLLRRTATYQQALPLDPCDIDGREGEDLHCCESVYRT